MVWLYSGDPGSSPRDAVRFEIGDTDSRDPLLQDAEVAYALKVEANIYGAAARCCESIARRFARQADYALGTHRVSASQRSEAYAKLGRELRLRATSSNAPSAGGISRREGLLDRTSDLKEPAFTRNLMANSTEREG